MGSSFERQPIQSAQSASSLSVTRKTSSHNALALVVITILAAVVFIETIIIAIMSTNYFDLANGTDVETEEIYEMDGETNTK